MRCCQPIARLKAILVTSLCPLSGQAALSWLLQSGIVSCSSQAQHVPQERTQNQLYVADITVRLQSILRSSGKEVSSAHTHSGPTVMPLCACAGCAQIILKMHLKTASSTGTEKKKGYKNSKQSLLSGPANTSCDKPNVILGWNMY